MNLLGTVRQDVAVSAAARRADVDRVAGWVVESPYGLPPLLDSRCPYPVNSSFVREPAGAAFRLPVAVAHRPIREHRVVWHTRVDTARRIAASHQSEPYTMPAAWGTREVRQAGMLVWWAFRTCVYPDVTVAASRQWTPDAATGRVSDLVVRLDRLRDAMFGGGYMPGRGTHVAHTIRTAVDPVEEAVRQAITEAERFVRNYQQPSRFDPC